MAKPTILDKRINKVITVRRTTDKRVYLSKFNVALDLGRARAETSPRGLQELVRQPQFKKSLYREASEPRPQGLYLYHQP